MKIFIANYLYCRNAQRVKEKAAMSDLPELPARLPHLFGQDFIDERLVRQARNQGLFIGAAQDR
jgi:hypothetical protein